LKDVYDEEIKGTIVLTIRIAESRYTGRWHVENRQ
jgi:hypothetical protein